MIRTWCKDHPIQFMACYLVFYLAFFKLLEQGIQVPDLVLHCRLDDLIPFCKYAIIPYYLWFAWIPCTLFYLLWFNDRREFWRLCLPLFTGMTLSLLFCAIVPNGTDLRPAYIYGNDIFTRAVRALWRTDTSTNVFPSIHVFNSVTLALAYHHCARLRGRKWLWVRVSADLLCVSIILSTMLLKQHSVFDVMGGIILALTLDAVADAVALRTAPSAQPSPCAARAFLNVYRFLKRGRFLFAIFRGIGWPPKRACVCSVPQIVFYVQSPLKPPPTRSSALRLKLYLFALSKKIRAAS